MAFARSRSTLIELVIFDCGGVLVDSERLAIKIDVQVLARLGWPMAEAEVIERFVGVRMRTSGRQLNHTLGVDSPTTGRGSSNRYIGALLPLSLVLSTVLLMR